MLTATARAFNRDVRKVIDRVRLDGDITAEMEQILQASLLGVYLTFYFETPHRRDLDGGLKITLDAVCTALGLDDRTVVDLHLTKRIDPLRPHVDIEIESIAEWSFDRSYVYLGDDASSTDGEQLEKLDESATNRDQSIAQ